MTEEPRRRRRGRRRGRGGHPPDKGPEEQARQQPEGRKEEDEAEEERPGRSWRPFARRGDEEEEEREGRERRRQEREERPGVAPHRNVSPLSFWRRGRHRTFREQPTPRQTFGRTLRRIRGMYFPPWVPVLFIVVVVFGILGALFFVQGAAGRPRIGQDHWHATYQVFVCGQRQPNFPTWEAGVHTHADGVIHIHPFVPREEGAGARLVKWFEYGGGKLTQDEMIMPGRPDETFKNGDTCPDGSAATLQVFVNGQKLDDWSRYIPKDGDRVRIVFGPEEATPQELEDRTVIDPSSATRTVELTITGAEGDAAFQPDSIEVRPGETVRVNIQNTGSISHSVRVAGPDGQYDTMDDYVSDPEIIEPGADGVLVIRFSEEGEFEFQDPSSPAAQGKIVVAGEAAQETPSPAAEEAEVTLDVSMRDDVFVPDRLEVGAGEKFRINLVNEGQLAHNLRIAGPDGEFETEDDLISTPSPLSGGDSGELVGQIDEPGEYPFRDDFHRAEMTGTIVVR